MRRHLSLIIGSIMIGIALFAIAVRFTSDVQAEVPIPDPVMFAQKAILSNQKFINENKSIVEEFARRKDNNAVQTGILQAYGYNYNWETGAVVKDANLQ